MLKIRCLLVFRETHDDDDDEIIDVENHITPFLITELVVLHLFSLLSYLIPRTYP